ncbi:2976_t:CDS:1, partial [Gigaspora rosea]
MESLLNNVSYSETLNIKTLNALDSIIKNSLPPNYKYLVDSFKLITSYEFLGAYENPFEAKFRINITTIEDTKVWFQQFMDLHKITMRETQGRTIKGIRYILSKRYHYIHSHTVKLKQGKNVTTNVDCETSKSEAYKKSTRIRDTGCPATL